MFNPNDVFPRPNLSDAATPWGRKITEAVRSAGFEIDRHGKLLAGNNRAINGQLGVITRQISELTNRKTLTVTPADLSVTGKATVTPLPSATRVFAFPATDVNRSGLLIVSATFVNSNNAHTARAFVEVLQGSTVIMRWDGAVPNATSSPAGWAETMSVARAISVTSGSNETFTIRMSRLGFTSTSTTLTMENINATILYGDRI